MGLTYDVRRNSPIKVPPNNERRIIVSEVSPGRNSSAYHPIITPRAALRLYEPSKFEAIQVLGACEISVSPLL